MHMYKYEDKRTALQLAKETWLLPTMDRSTDNGDSVVTIFVTFISKGERT